jgi:hypothetical protein
MRDLRDHFKYVPIPVDFAGLRGDTVSLVKSGWNLSLESHRRHDKDSILFRIAGKHEALRLNFISGSYEVTGEYLRYASDPMILLSNLMLPVRIENIANHIVLNTQSVGDMLAVNWSGELGMFDMSSSVPSRPRSFEEYFHFPSNNNQIVLPESKLWTIEDALDQIRKAQEPFQKELLKMKGNADSQVKTRLELVGIA